MENAENVNNQKEVQATKKRRISLDDEGNSNIQCETTCGSHTLESLILKIILFFGVEENRNLDRVETALIPSLLRGSVVFKGGELADLTPFKYLNTHQLRYLNNIFMNATEIKIDHITYASNLLGFLSCFGKVKKATIFLEENDNLAGRNIHTKIEKLKIIANYRSNWNESIEHIVFNCPLLRGISITNGNLSLMTCIRLQTRDITMISLKNVIIQPHLKKALTSTILNCKNLKKLKLIFTDSYVANPTFHQLVQEFLWTFNTQNNTLKELSFTLDQFERQNFTNLLNLTELEKLKIYYTTQQSSNNLSSLLQTLKHMPSITLQFREYHLTPEDPITNQDEYAHVMQMRSTSYRILIQSYFENAEIRICSNYNQS